MSSCVLDNIIWHALSGSQAGYAAGTNGARRYGEGMSPIAAFVDKQQPVFDDLRPHCQPGEHIYVKGWSGPAPAGWRIEAETRIVMMLWAGDRPVDDEAPEAVRLGPEHADQALQLVSLTQPGPFGPRTLELGEYFGCFHNGRLVAMAGERMFAAPWREISGVCTHPDHQGRGLARRLMLKLLRRQMARGESTLLHVMADNVNAHGLYRRMGFQDHLIEVVRIISCC